MGKWLVCLAALWLAGPLWAGEAVAELPVVRVEGSADGEDPSPWLYFYEDGRDFSLGGDGEGRFRMLQLASDDGTVRMLSAPDGSDYDPARVYLSHDGGLLTIGLLPEGDWLVVDLDAASILARLLHREVTVEGERLRFSSPDEKLQRRAAAVQARPEWRSRIHDQHRPSIVHALDFVGEVLAAMPDDAYVEGDAKRELTRLLARPKLTLAASQLAGDWRVRSLQGARDALYAYPWFKARIVDEKNGLRLRKTTGSQRRSGWLYPYDEVASSWVFVGGRTVNDDPERPYSDLSGPVGEHDSVGRLFALGGDHLLLLLDATPEAGFEVYELRRP